MSRAVLDYDKLVHDALRGVVRAALAASQNGLPGYHYFYVLFDTRHPGVQLADYLRERFPEEMKIVLQHQFWGLEVGGDWFEVTLQFNRINERLHVPFAAITGFADPSSKFELRFAVDLEEAEREAAEAAPHPLPEKKKVERQESPSEPRPSGEVVTLDAFRKK